LEVKEEEDRSTFVAGTSKRMCMWKWYVYIYTFISLCWIHSCLWLCNIWEQYMQWIPAAASSYPWNASEASDSLSGSFTWN